MSKQRQAGNSRLVYKASFKWAFLKPVYWPSWLSVLLLFVLFLLPDKLTVWLARLLGCLVRKLN